MREYQNNVVCFLLYIRVPLYQKMREYQNLMDDEVKQIERSFIPKDERVPKFIGHFSSPFLCSFIPKDERVPKSISLVTGSANSSFIPKDERVPKYIVLISTIDLVPLYQKMREYQND